MAVDLAAKWFDLCVEAKLNEAEIMLFNKLIKHATATFVKRYGNNIKHMADCNAYLADELVHHAGQNIAECDLIIKLHETAMFNKFIAFFIDVFIDAVKETK